jgi:hypothetical protein
MIVAYPFINHLDLSMTPSPKMRISGSGSGDFEIDSNNLNDRNIWPLKVVGINGGPPAHAAAAACQDRSRLSPASATEPPSRSAGGHD